MKFQKYYDQNKVPEWREMYIQYGILKKMLYPFTQIVKQQSIKTDKVDQAYIEYQLYKKQQLPTLTFPENVEERLFKMQVDFEIFLKSEMKKSNQFFILYARQIEIKIKKLNKNMSIYTKNELEKVDYFFLNKKQITAVDKQNFLILKQSTISIYREIKLLHNFSHHNKQALLKIFKHYRSKMFYMENTELNFKTLQKFYEKLEIFQESISLGRVNDEIETFYSAYFCSKNQDQGEYELKIASSEKLLSSQNQFSYGVYLGFALTLLTFISTERESFMTRMNSDYNLIFPMFRGLMLIFLYCWLYILNIYGWNKSFINYRQIFQFGFHYSTVYQLLKTVSFFSMIFLLCLTYSVEKEIANDDQAEGDSYYSPIFANIKIPAEIGPIVVWGAIFIYMCWPSAAIFNGQGRQYFWNLMLKCFISAIYPMLFVISWATDQFVSFVGPFKDIYYTMCFYFYYFQGKNSKLESCGSSKNIEIGLLVAVLPLILRMIQCVRQGYDQGKFVQTDTFYNFFKYATSFMVAVFSYLSKFYHLCFYFWILFAMMSCIYSYYWDVMKDWKFFQPDTKYSSKQIILYLLEYLRRQLAYDSPKFYYTIMLVNIPLRMTWMLTISPNVPTFFGIWNQTFTFIISLLEIFRRCLWNFIRVEREHVVNQGAFRAVPEVIFPYDSDMVSSVKDLIQSKVLDKKHSLNFSRSSSKVSVGDYFSMSNADQQEKSIDSPLKSLHSNQEEEIQQEFRQFQKRFEDLKIEYQDYVKKIEKDLKEVQLLIQNLSFMEIDIHTSRALMD